jgi:hypothetical protein
MLNREQQVLEEQRSIIAKFVMGEITLDQFEAERERIVSSNQDITDAKAEKVATAKAKFGL